MNQEDLQAKYDALVAKHDRFVDYTRKMRGRQKEFFKYRAKVDLENSKRYEREVDKLIDEEVQAKQSKQESMF